MNLKYQSFILGIAAAFLFSASVSQAQWNSNYFSGVVQPNLSTQNQIQNPVRNQTVPPASSYPTGTRVSTGSTVTKTAKDDDLSTKRVEALLVSINDYKGAAGLSNLSGCNNDTRIMKKWLETNVTKTATVTVLSDDAALSRQSPTYDAILRELQTKAQADCDRLIVVFAGHGVNVGGKSFLCPSDVETTKISDVEQAPLNRLLAVTELLALLKKGKAKEVFLILDACRNSSEEKGFMREFAELLKDNDKNFKKEGDGSFVILTSCSSGQEALEIFTKNGDGHGSFIYHFVEGLSGHADFAGCYDGDISLVEAYNYAYSRVSDEAQKHKKRQTPEIFMASANGNMTLASSTIPPVGENETDIQFLANIQSLTDIQFLMRTGVILANNRRVKSANEVGAKALDSVLDNVPNNSLAYALRGSVRRKLGRYEDALSDLNRIGQKFQLYAKADNTEGAKSVTDVSIPLKKTPDRNGEDSGASVKNDTLLTISKIDGDFFFVQEINNEDLGANQGWIPRNAVTWSRKKADNTITATRMQQTIRSTAPTSYSGGGMISPSVGGTFGGASTFSSGGVGPVYH